MNVRRGSARRTIKSRAASISAPQIVILNKRPVLPRLKDPNRARLPRPIRKLPSFVKLLTSTLAIHQSNCHANRMVIYLHDSMLFRGS
jgi:hypothetical protein